MTTKDPRYRDPFGVSLAFTLLLELSTRNHLLALNALGVRWVKAVKHG